MRTLCRRLVWIAVFALVHVAAGCAAMKQTYLYSEWANPVTAKGTRKLAIGVHDQRPYVVSGAVDPSWVGQVRGGFGNPWPCVTASGAPLAKEMAGSICAPLHRNGYTCVAVPLPAKASPAEARNVLRAAGADEGIYVAVTAWKSDTYYSTYLNYDVTLEVIRNGATVATNHLAGERDLGCSYFDPPGLANEEIPKAYGRIMGELLEKPDVVAALNAP